MKLSTQFIAIAIVTAMFAFGSDACSAQNSSGLQPGIGWFGQLEVGLQEAKRTNRPILLMSAAPQCAGVPGMW